MRNIYFILAVFLTLNLYADPIKWDDCKKTVIRKLPNIHGWCSEEKAAKMMDLIFETRPEVCVEIGVFGGSSIYPTASALRFIQKGVVYAIDPWSNDDCLMGYDSNDPNYIWWKMLNLEEIYNQFRNLIYKEKLVKFCKILRMSSKDALVHFDDESIDILHIDGNHTEKSALFDVKTFLPKVKKGGYIWFDDVNWSSTNKAIQKLSEESNLHEEKSTATCYLFQKT